MAERRLYGPWYVWKVWDSARFHFLKYVVIWGLKWSLFILTEKVSNWSYWFSGWKNILWYLMSRRTNVLYWHYLKSSIGVFQILHNLLCRSGMIHGTFLSRLFMHSFCVGRYSFFRLLILLVFFAFFFCLIWFS